VGRYTGPKDKKSRAARTKLFLKGERDLSPKGALTRRPYPPGMHGAKHQRAKSEFGAQLLEKQKVKWVYGVLERQFKRYVNEAQRHRGLTALVLAQMLEKRLDNVVYRLGFAPSRSAARQLVGHGHITVNGKKVSTPSYSVRSLENVGIREQSRSKRVFSELPVRLKKYTPPSWLALDREDAEGKIIGEPSLEEAGIPANMQKIIEFYSR